jgi:hypothetical protein
MSGHGRKIWLLPPLFAALYLIFPNRDFTTDGVDYATHVVFGAGLFHPHHLLFSFTCHELYRLVTLFGPVDVFTLMATLTALVTALNVGLVGVLVCRLTHDRRTAAVAMLLFGLSNATWFLATGAEPHPLAIAFELLALLSVTRDGAPSVVPLALLAMLAVLFRQESVFFVLVLAGYVLATTRSPGRFVAFLTITGAGSVLAYVLAAAHEGIRTPGDFAHWIMSYATGPDYKSGLWGHGLSLERIPRLLSGIRDAVVSTGPLHRNARGDHPLVTPGNIIAAGGAFVFVVASAIWIVRGLIRRAPATPGPRFVRGLLLAWIVVDALFIAWWDNGNLKFWGLLLAPVILLGARPWRTPAWLAAPAIAGLAIANFAGGILPDSQPQNSLVYQVIHQIGCDRLRDGDVLVGGTYELRPYALYACRKTVELAPLTEVAALVDRPGLTANVYLLETELRPHDDELDPLRAELSFQ